MICFEVSINGKKVCTAGVGDTGVLTAIIAWVNSIHSTSGERIDLRVGGSPPNHAHMDWFDDGIELRPGDEVTVKIIESAMADEAAHVVQTPVGEPEWWKKYKVS